MAVYFFDSSGLVKRYVAEAGTNWVQAIADPSAQNVLFIAQITGVEVIAAVTRRVRTRQITPTDASTAIGNFRHDYSNQFSLLEITDQIVRRAMDLTEAHGLRAYDAVQLAAAAEVNSQAALLGFATLGMPSMTLVSSDDDLNTAAAAEGLVVEDPRNYP